MWFLRWAWRKWLWLDNWVPREMTVACCFSFRVAQILQAWIPREPRKPSRGEQGSLISFTSVTLLMHFRSRARVILVVLILGSIEKALIHSFMVRTG